MSGKINLNLLIVGAILLQGILGSPLGDDHNNSSNLQFRTKRMVGHAFRGLGDWLVNDVIHIVKIFKDDERVCTGVIVTPEHVLTASECVRGLSTSNRVESGAPGRGPIKTHQIIRISIHKRLNLLRIRPPIDPESRINRPILPAREELPEDMHSITIAWTNTGQVRAIMEVEVDDWDDCVIIHRNHEEPFHVTKDHICTVPSHEEHNRLFRRDRGSALVIGDRLFAILDQAGSYHDILCDVYVLVSHGNEYYTWLMGYIQPYLHSDPHLYNPARRM